MTLSLIPFVRSSPFFSFSVLGVLSCPKEFQWCFKKVLRVFEGSMKFQGCLKDVFRVSKNVSRSFKEISRMSEESFKVFSRVFERYVREVAVVS